MQKLSVKGLTLAFGIITGLWMLVLALVALATGEGSELVGLYSSFFAGYEATLGGAISGAVWGFVYGAIFGGLVAWLYNIFAR